MYRFCKEDIVDAQFRVHTLDERVGVRSVAVDSMFILQITHKPNYKTRIPHFNWCLYHHIQVHIIRNQILSSKTM